MIHASILELEDPFIPNTRAAKFVNCELQTWNKNRSEQVRKEQNNRDSRYWIPFYKIGGRVYYKKSDLDSYIERNRVS
jgi:hypothetical protein